MLPSAWYRLIHTCMAALLTPAFRLASRWLILPSIHARARFTFSSIVAFCFCGIIKLPSCRQFCFSLSLIRGAYHFLPAAAPFRNMKGSCQFLAPCFARDFSKFVFIKNFCSKKFLFSYFLISLFSYCKNFMCGPSFNFMLCFSVSEALADGK